MRIAVVIPTYNEAKNLPRLIPDLFRLPLDLSVLFVDDNSPDGTGRLAEGYPGRAEVLHRSGKLGIASADMGGFGHALGRGSEAVLL